MEEINFLITEILSHSDCLYEKEELKNLDENKLMNISKSMLLPLRKSKSKKDEDCQQGSDNE